MSALDKIAELHHENVTFDGSFHYCGECKQPWPCPTRRLCDEASAEIVSQTDAHIAHLVHSLTAERDAARANAERLAAAIDRYHGNPSDVHSRREDADCDLCVARAAHDALTGDAS